jgi:hypothetical protein
MSLAVQILPISIIEPQANGYFKLIRAIRRSALIIADHSVASDRLCAHRRERTAFEGMNSAAGRVFRAAITASPVSISRDWENSTDEEQRVCPSAKRRLMRRRDH